MSENNPWLDLPLPLTLTSAWVRRSLSHRFSGLQWWPLTPASRRNPKSLLAPLRYIPSPGPRSVPVLLQPVASRWQTESMSSISLLWLLTLVLPMRSSVKSGKHRLHHRRCFWERHRTFYQNPQFPHLASICSLGFWNQFLLTVLTSWPTSGMTASTQMTLTFTFYQTICFIKIYTLPHTGQLPVPQLLIITTPVVVPLSPLCSPKTAMLSPL